MRRPPRFSEFPRYPVVAGTIALAVGVSVAYWAGVNVKVLEETIDVRRGHVWRLLTSALPHSNPIHLLFNVIWLWVLGTIVERSFGSVRTLALFLVLALGSSAAEYAFLDGGIGLSGVVYGLFGFLYVLSRRDWRFQDAMDSRTTQLFVVWFFLCIVFTVTGAMPVANIAHGVGALLGAAIGLAVTTSDRVKRLAGLALTGIVLPAMLVALAVFGRAYVNFGAGDEEAHAGYEALMADRNAEAARWGRDAVRIAPRDAGAWYNLGIAQQRLGHKQEAAADYQRARISAGPGQQQVHRHRARDRGLAEVADTQ
jgi:GlpG protein